MVETNIVTREEALSFLIAIQDQSVLSIKMYGALGYAIEALKREQRMIEAAKEGKEMEFFIDGRKFVCREVE